jgi:hypothetical protein
MFTIDVMLPFFELVLNIPMFIAISTPKSIFFIHSFIILPTLMTLFERFNIELLLISYM